MELQEIKERFIDLRAKGYSFDKIAKELGKAKQTLIDWSKELKDEIANIKALELEALYEKYYLQKEAKIKSYGTILNKITTELESRDFSNVNTWRLLEIYPLYLERLNNEIVEPVFKSSQDIKEERLDKELLEELTTINTSANKIVRLKVG
jgi:transcriptional regulator with XRE-family HTH domain